LVSVRKDEEVQCGLDAEPETNTRLSRNALTRRRRMTVVGISSAQVPKSINRNQSHMRGNTEGVMN